MCLVRRKHGVGSLFNTKMKRGEPLREFMKLLDAVILQLETVNIDTIMQVVMEAILPNSKFFTSNSLKPLKSVDDLFQRANRYALLEDDLTTTSMRSLLVAEDKHTEIRKHVGRTSPRQDTRDRERDSRTSSSRECNSARERSNRREHPSRPREQWKPYEEREPRIQFTLSPSLLLAIIQSVEGFMWSRSMLADTNQKDQTKYCCYHRQHDHVTNHGRYLWFMLETL